MKVKSLIEPFTWDFRRPTMLRGHEINFLVDTNLSSYDRRYLIQKIDKVLEITESRVENSWHQFGYVA